MFRASRLGQAFTGAAMLALSFSAQAELMVHDAWVREAPPTAKMLAGYMTLHNNGDQVIDVVAVDSPAFAAVEMHRSEVRDGVARMVQQEKLSVPADGSLELAPGGYHLMLMQPSAPLRAGDQVELRMQLSDGTVVSVAAPVRKANGAGSQQNHEHHHH